MFDTIYNDFDPYVCDWLCNLSEAGHIARGIVSALSIDELVGTNITTAQFHAFAGLGVWSYALRLAGWPDTSEVWTGSCPCQPFSVAGKQKGVGDERHLWPEWFRLIKECRPPVLFGEQVGGPAGRAWLDSVSTDLEAVGYAIGAADLCAAGVGAPHIRQRLFFMAYTPGERLNRLRLQLQQRRQNEASAQATGRGEVGDMANPNSIERGSRRAGKSNGHRAAESQRCGGVGAADQHRGGWNPGAIRRAQEASTGTRGETGCIIDQSQLAGATRGFWAGAEWIPCRDGKARPAQPGAFPLAHGVAGRVGRLRAYGNAIVPQVAAEFVSAGIEFITGSGTREL